MLSDQGEDVSESDDSDPGEDVSESGGLSQIDPLDPLGGVLELPQEFLGCCCLLLPWSDDL